MTVDMTVCLNQTTGGDELRSTAASAEIVSFLVGGSSSDVCGLAHLRLRRETIG